MDLEAQVPVLEEALKQAADEAAEFEAKIAALQGRRHEMERDLQTFLASREETASTTGAQGALRDDRKVAEAQNAFDRALSGATGLPGAKSADAQTAVKLAELEKLTRDNRIQERLAAAKAAADGAG